MAGGSDEMLLLKGVIGAFLVISISLVSKSKFYYIAGLLPLFPTFAVITHLSVHSVTNSEKLHDVIIFGFLSLIPYSVYLLSMLILNGNKFSIKVMLLISVVLWCATSATLVHFWAARGAT